MQQFLWGALATGSITVGMIFLKFWSQTRDRLFLMFAASFLVFSLNWTVLAFTSAEDETRHYAYFIRMFAFLLILVGIIEKNRAANR